MDADAFSESVNALGWDAVDFPNLERSFRKSYEQVNLARSTLRGALRDDPGVDIVAFGSLARHEMTTESDLDYLAIVFEFDKTPGASRVALKAADDIRATLSATEEAIRPPGATGLFGKTISALDLVEVIGLEADTNHSHSRRILFLEESVSLYRPDRHAQLLEAIIRRYLEVKPVGRSLVPRFLLNDLARYWRTLTIDYQAKTPGLPGQSTYSLRYLKLLLSRKFTYAASILPLLVAGIENSDPNERARADDVAYFTEVFSQTPILRFLQASQTLLASGAMAQDESALRETLLIVEQVNQLLGDKAWREEIGVESSKPAPKEESKYSEALLLVGRLEENLEKIFLSAPLLALTSKYLLF